MMSFRWNIVLQEEDFLGYDREKLTQLQNKLGLAILAFWLENDGSLPLTLYEKSKELIKNESFREQYLKNSAESNLLYRHIIRNIHSSYQKTLDELSPLVRPVDGPPLQNANITARTVGIVTLLHLSDLLVTFYNTLSENNRNRFKHELLKLLRKVPHRKADTTLESGGSSSTKSSESNTNEVQRFIEQVKRIRETFAKPSDEWATFISHLEGEDFKARYIGKVDARVYLLQLMSTLEAFEVQNNSDRLAIL